MIEERPYRIDVRQYARGDALELLADRGDGHFLESQPASQGVVMGQQALDLAPERQRIGQIHDADGAPTDLVLIGGADAAPGGADARERIRGFANRVDFLVQRQDQGRVLGDAQALGCDGDPLLLEAVDLLQQRERIDDHPVADHRKLPRSHDPGRQQR